MLDMMALRATPAAMRPKAAGSTSTSMVSPTLIPGFCTWARAKSISSCGLVTLSTTSTLATPRILPVFGLISTRSSRVYPPNPLPAALMIASCIAWSSVSREIPRSRSRYSSIVSNSLLMVVVGF